MARTIHTLSESAARQLAADSRRLRAQPIPTDDGYAGDEHGAREDELFGYITETITARVGTQLGSGKMAVWRVTGAGEIADAGREQKVWNTSLVPAFPNSVVLSRATRHFQSGLWLLDRWSNSILAKTRSAGVAARSGDNVGAALVDAYRINGTTLEPVTDGELEAVNISSSAAGATKWVKLEVEGESERPVIDLESCT